VNGVYKVAEIRAAEQALMATLPDGALMQRAATGLATQCARLLGTVGRVYAARVVLLVGAGSNGGDALFAGAALARRGARVDAVLLGGERTHVDGLARLRRDGGQVTTHRVDAIGLVRAADLIVDGIVGIGGHGTLTGLAGELAMEAAASNATTVAVDIASGVDADTGAVDDIAIRADVTVVMGALKPGVVAGAGADHAGEVRLVEIGLGPHLPAPMARVLDGADAAAVLPDPGPDDDKYTRGVLGVVAGSPSYPGAGVLSTGAAIHSGAGMLRYLGRAPDEIKARYPEVVVQAQARPGDVRVQAWVVGPGLGTDGDALALVTEVLATDVPVIIDADAITLIAARPGLLRARSAPTVLTPHDREFTRLGFDLGADRIGAAQHAAAEFGVTMLLKGNATVVAAPDRTTYLNRTGTPWLATAGSGDVLSGIIGSLLAAGVEVTLAAAVGAHLHGVAGQLAGRDGPPSASDIQAAVRPAIRAITT
jgi:ADP-dependent NAD(P)H-hydrate dehydratase / NAD(P)H-hydrate epimerase